MMKVGKCAVCGVDCCWFYILDGELFEQEVCSYAHLGELARLNDGEQEELQTDTDTLQSGG